VNGERPRGLSGAAQPFGRVAYLSPPLFFLSNKGTRVPHP